jgi:hypothetical protein
VGVSQAIDFHWKEKSDGMQPPEMRRLKQPEDENAKLKKIRRPVGGSRDASAPPALGVGLPNPGRLPTRPTLAQRAMWSLTKPPAQSKVCHH